MSLSFIVFFSWSTQVHHECEEHQKKDSRSKIMERVFGVRCEHTFSIISYCIFGTTIEGCMKRIAT